MNQLTMYFMLCLIVAGQIGNIAIFARGKGNVPSETPLAHQSNVVQGARPRVTMYYTVGSTLIAFSVFILLCSSLIYVPSLPVGVIENETVRSNLQQSMMFLYSRFNIFFSEIFLCIIYACFVIWCLKYESQITTLTVNETLRYQPTWWFLLGFFVVTSAQVLVIVGAYIFQKTSESSLLNEFFFLKHFMPVRLLQLNVLSGDDSRLMVHDAFRSINSILILGAIGMLIGLYINFEYHMTDDWSS